MVKPPFPVPKATEPFWQQQLHELDDHRSTDRLPEAADIVVIGAGYAGVSTAYHLLQRPERAIRKPTIVILEARGACSGATGRNGVSTYPL